MIFVRHLQLAHTGRQLSVCIKTKYSFPSSDFTMSPSCTHLCLLFGKLECILQNDLPLVNTFLGNFWKKAVKRLSNLLMKQAFLSHIGRDELVGNAAVSAGMFHFPAYALTAQCFTVEADAGFLQLMFDNGRYSSCVGAA